MSEEEEQFIETVSKGLKLLGLPELDKEEKDRLLRRLREVNETFITDGNTT